MGFGELIMVAHLAAVAASPVRIPASRQILYNKFFFKPRTESGFLLYLNPFGNKIVCIGIGIFYFFDHGTYI